MTQLKAILISLILGVISSKAHALCVQTFNAYGPLYAPNKSLRMKLAAEDFRKEGCEILQLQELWTDSEYNEFESELNQTTSPWNVLNFNRLLSNPSGLHDRYGLVTFSKFEITQHFFHTYPVNFEKDLSLLGALEWVREKANVFKAIGILRLSRNKDSLDDVYVVNTHTHPHSRNIRVAQMAYLILTLKRLMRKDLPFIITGDFNSTPQSLEMRLLRYVLNAQDTLNWSDTCTYCTENPYYLGITPDDRRIDYIMTVNSRKTHIRTMASEISPKYYQSQFLSDHYGVRANIEFESMEKVKVTKNVINVRRRLALITISEALDVLNHSAEIETQSLARELAQLHSDIRIWNTENPLVLNLMR